MKSRLLCIVLLAISARAQSITCAQATSAPSIQLAGAPTCTATSCTYVDSSSIVNGATYGYVVTASDLAGNACSNYATNVTIPATGTHSVTLTFVPSTTPSVSYAVFRASLAAAVTISATVN